MSYFEKINGLMDKKNAVDIIHPNFNKPLIRLHMIFVLTSSYNVIDMVLQYGGAKIDD